MKKKIILGAASAAVILSSLTACGNQIESSSESSTPSSSSSVVNYATLAKPAMSQTSGTTYSWAPVSGATGYVASLDDGKPFGIGTNVIEEEQNKFVYYVQSTQNLTDGKHTIKFAAYKDENVLSDWTDSYTFYVNNTVVMSTPTLSENLTITSGSYFDHVSYDFGNGVKIEEDVNGLVNRYTPNVSVLGLNNRLTVDEPYIVTCTVSYKDVVSEVSNPAVFKLDAGKYVKAETPTVIKGEYKFAEDPTYIKAKFDDKEFVIDYSTIGYYARGTGYLTPEAIVENLIENEAITAEEALAFVDSKVSVKVIFDDNHYYESDYSEEVEFTYGDDEQIFEDLYYYYNIDAQVENKKYVFGLTEEHLGYSLVRYEVKASDKVIVTYSDNIKELITIDYSALTKSEEFTITGIYERNGLTLTETYESTLIVSDCNLTNLRCDGSRLVWSPYEEFLNETYEVEVTQGGTTKVYPTDYAHIETSELELASGEFSVKVYAVINEKRIDASVSQTLTLEKLEKVTEFEIDKDKKIKLEKGICAYAYDNRNSTSHSIYYNEATINMNGVQRLVVHREGNGINTIDSDETVFECIVEDIGYNIVDGKYLVLTNKDFKFKDFVDEKYIDYITDDNKFDLDEYRIKEGKKSIDLTRTYDKLSSESFNISYSEWIQDFDYVTGYAISNVKYENNVLKFDCNITDCKYEIVLKLNDEEKIHKIVSTTSLDLSDVDVSGTYSVEIRVVGNGSILSGNYIPVGTIQI